MRGVVHGFPEQSSVTIIPKGKSCKYQHRIAKQDTN